MAVNACELWSKGIKIVFFPKNLGYKNRLAAGGLPTDPTATGGWGLCPQTSIATGGWGLRPHTPVCDTCEYTSFLNTSPKLDIFAF